MEELKIKKTAAISAFRNADSTGKKLLSDLLGKENLDVKITDRIKSFEDACDVQGIDPTDFLRGIILPAGVNAKALKACCKLMIIADALNEGWKPDWNDGSQKKWYPWFQYSSSGFGFAYSDFDFACTYTAVGSRLYFKSNELAEYAGREFLSIYNDMLNY